MSAQSVSRPAPPHRGEAPARPHAAGLDVAAADVSTATLAQGTRDNVAGALVERVFGAGLLLALPLLLTPSALGAYYEIAAVLSIGAIVGVAGLDLGVVRFSAVAGERGELGEVRTILRAAAAASALPALALGVALWAAAPRLARAFDDPAAAIAFRLAAPGIPLAVLAALLVAPARGMKSMRPTVVALQVVQPGVQLAATLGLLGLGLGLRGAAAALSVAAFGAAVAGVLFHRRLALPPGTGGPRAGALLRFSLPAAGMTLMGTALLWVDTLLLGALRPPDEVATYGLLVRLFLVSSAVLFTAVQSFGPLVAQLAARRDYELLEHRLRASTRWVVLLAGPVVVLGMVLAKPVLRLFGQHAVGAGGAAALALGAGFLVDVFTGPVGHVLTMSGRSGLNLANNAGALVLNVALNLVLIPRFGLTGAAISWASVLVAANVARVLEVRALYGIGPGARSLVRPAAALAAGVAVEQVVAGALPWSGAGSAFGVLVLAVALLVPYGLTLLVLGVHAEDRAFVRLLLGRRSPEAAGA